MPILPVDKPLGVTSHDVVAEARRRLGTRRVGHAGTLDPLATGVLVLLTEEATKLSPFLTASDKDYLAWIAFGAATPTLDAEGPVVAEADASDLTSDRLEAALPPFLAMREQRPPAFSAVKQGGVRSYQRARQGEAQELAPRPAGYLELELLALAPDRGELPSRFAPAADGTWRASADGRAFDLPEPLGTLPTALLRLRVRAGTYVRAFARDLGEALGLPAHLAALVRTRAGRVDLARASSLDTLVTAAPLAPADVLPYPTRTLDADTARRVRLGQRPSTSFQGRATLLDPDGELVAVAEEVDGRVRLLRVWAAGDG